MSQHPLLRQVKRYWFEDGLAEIVTGVGFVGYALALWLAEHLSGWETALLDILVIGTPIVLIFAARWVVQHLKWRITYPRTGYVAYPKRFRDRRQVLRVLGLWALFTLGTGLAAFILSRGSAGGYLVTLGLLLAVFELALGYAQAMPRMGLYAAVAALAGLVGAALPTPWQQSEVILRGGWHLGWLGLAQIAGGALALQAYLRRHPEPLEGDLP